MTPSASGDYRFEFTGPARAAIQQVSDLFEEAGRLREFANLLKRAVERMTTDPHGFGDPQYRSKYVDGHFYLGLIRPVGFRYVIYQQARAVVLLSVYLFAPLDSERQGS